MILLDTHAWLWWLGDPERLGREAAAAIEEAVRQEAVYISAISAWEVAMLVSEGRLELDRTPGELATGTEAMPFVHFVDVDHRIGVRSVGLDLAHQDPADRIIAASALWLGCALATADHRLQEADWLPTVW